MLSRVYVLTRVFSGALFGRNLTRFLRGVLRSWSFEKQVNYCEEFFRRRILEEKPFQRLVSLILSIKE